MPDPCDLAAKRFDYPSLDCFDQAGLLLINGLAEIPKSLLAMCLIRRQEVSKLFALLFRDHIVCCRIIMSTRDSLHLREPVSGVEPVHSFASCISKDVQAREVFVGRGMPKLDEPQW